MLNPVGGTVDYNYVVSNFNYTGCVHALRDAYCSENPAERACHSCAFVLMTPCRFRIFLATACSIGTLYTGIGGCPGNLQRWQCQNLLQSTLINSSRLHIPASIIGETLTAGCAGGTIFPQPVLQGATFNVDLISQVAVSVARQARTGGIDRGLSPVLQVDTDARFGRFEVGDLPLHVCIQHKCSCFMV